LSSLIRHGANVVVFLINNGGYTIERMLVEGPFNDIQAWNYPALLEAFGGKSRSEIVRTEEDLESALQRVSQSQNHDVKLVEIDVSKSDCVQTMVKAAKTMRKRIQDGVPKDVNLPTLLQQ
jgi:TPP-dependent 2-oxoacid decarboxylase